MLSIGIDSAFALPPVQAAGQASSSAAGPGARPPIPDDSFLNHVAMSNEDSDADEDFLAPIPGNEVNEGNGVDASQSSLTLLDAQIHR